MNPIKVLYVVSTLKKTGPTNQLFNIIKYLDKKKFSPYIITLSPESKNSEYERFLEQGVTIKSLGLSRVRIFFNGFKKLQQKVQLVDPDIIHSQGIRADILVAKYLSEYNHCNTVRNYVKHDYCMKYGKILGNLFAKTHLNTIKKIKKPIACSDSVAHLLKKHHNIDIQTIQNGVDNEVYQPIHSEEKKSLRKKLNLNEKKVYFITTGDLISRKDPITLINAFKVANIEGNAQLIVLGDGKLKKQCLELANEDILMIGHVKN